MMEDENVKKNFVTDNDNKMKIMKQLVHEKYPNLII